MKMSKRNLFVDYVPMALTAVLIIIFAVLKEQSFVRTLPTLITLVVQILLARANRYAFLLGGANSLLYAISYFGSHLYFEFFFAIAISAPMQIYSFFNWKRNESGGRPRIKEMSAGGKLLIAASVLSLWLFCTKFVGDIISSSEHIVLDSLIFALGVASTALSAFVYFDAQYIQLLSAAISLVLWATIVVNEPANANYLIISAYNMFRSIETFLGWRRYTPKKHIPKKICEGDRYENKSYS